MSHKLFTYTSLFTLTLIFSFAQAGYAATWDGTVKSTVEINSSTANGPSLTNEDSFSFSLDNIGDLNNDGVEDLVVGAPFDDEGGTNRGAVHILFMNTDGGVDSTVEINDATANGPVLANSDTFGWSVANIGDLNNDGVEDLVVGAPFDDEGGTNRGAVHILFMNTDGSVDLTIEINSSTANGPSLANDDRFGYGVAGIGDLNNDGVEDIAVGAPYDDEGGSANGVIHILFMNTDGSVDSTVEINDATANGPVLDDAQDILGTDIANIGDLDGDGVQDLAVGAANSEAVHILFMNTDGSLNGAAKINSSTDNGPVTAAGAWFGFQVSTVGDLNGDGVVDIAVGAHIDDVTGTDRGAIHIIYLNTDGSVVESIRIDDAVTNGPTLSNLDAFGVS